MNFENATIRKWDINSPSCDKALKVANLLNVSLDWLLTGKGNPPFSTETSEIINDQQELLDLYSKLDERGKGEVIGYMKAKINN